MTLFNINRPIFLFVYLLVVIIIPSIDSMRIKIKNTLPIESRTTDYKHFAKFCYIDDYQAWIQRQQELKIWYDLAKLLKLPIHENTHFQRELKQYRLQYECLRIVERLPVSVGPG